MITAALIHGNFAVRWKRGSGWRRKQSWQQRRPNCQHRVLRQSPGNRDFGHLVQLTTAAQTRFRNTNRWLDGELTYDGSSIARRTQADTRSRDIRGASYPGSATNI